MQRNDKGRVETGLEKQRPGCRERPQRDSVGHLTLSSKEEVQTPPLGQIISWAFLPLPKAGWGLTQFPCSQVKVDKSCVLEHVTRDRVRRDQRRRPPTRVHLKEVRPCPQLARVGGQLSLDPAA